MNSKFIIIIKLLLLLPALLFEVNFTCSIKSQLNIVKCCLLLFQCMGALHSFLSCDKENTLQVHSRYMKLFLLYDRFDHQLINIVIWSHCTSKLGRVRLHQRNKLVSMSLLHTHTHTHICIYTYHCTFIYILVLVCLVYTLLHLLTKFLVHSLM